MLAFFVITATIFLTSTVLLAAGSFRDASRS